MQKKRVGIYTKRTILNEALVQQQLQKYEIVDFRPLFREWMPQWEARGGVASFDPIVAKEIRTCDALITFVDSYTLPQELRQNHGSLRYICHTRGVLKAYFPRFLMENGVRISNWGDAPAKNVAGKAITLLMALLYQVSALDRKVRGSSEPLLWQSYNSEHLDMLTVGLYGCGAIGRCMAKYCLAMGMKVLVFDPWAKVLPEGTERVDDLDTLFGRSQIVSIHAGLSPETTGSVNTARLSLLPVGGIVINTARPGIIDETALLVELRANRLMAGLDVMEHEGRWDQSPLIHERNCILTGHGHFKAQTPPGQERPPSPLPAFVPENLDAFFSGRPLYAEILGLEHYDRTT